MNTIILNLAINKTLKSIPVSLKFERPKNNQYMGKTLGDSIFIQEADGKLQLIISLGEKVILDKESLRRAGGFAAKQIISRRIAEIEYDIGELDLLKIPNADIALMEGLLLGGFDFNNYKSMDQKKQNSTIFIDSTTDSSSLTEKIHKITVVSNSVCLAREMSHEPANVINPVTLEECCKKLAESNNLMCTVVDEKVLAKLKAGGILSVGKGSKTPPRFIILEYIPINKKSSKPVVLIGKTITFDTGGYSLKNSENIQGMKYDKSGGMDILAVLIAASNLKLNVHIVGIIAAAENMISRDATRPDDIIVTMSGLSVEIISTDAEGRMVLADALTYAQNYYQPKAIIDIATLTGGIIVALGRNRAGIMSNNSELTARLCKSGEETSEFLWRLPLDNEYFDLIKGDDADLKNAGGREASSIMGGMFLKQFVKDEIPWAHIDIAGTSVTEKELPYTPKGATGFGVRLLINYLESLPFEKLLLKDI